MKKGIKPPNYIQYLDFSIIKKSKISNNLKNFIYEGTFFRITILGTIIYAIKNIKKGSFILDVGAGDSPYKELFTNYKYKSTDFSNTKYHKYKNIDYICSTDNIPIKDSTVDAIICTEVIEHVQNIKRLPGAVQCVVTNFRGLQVKTIPEKDIPSVLLKLGKAAKSVGRLY